MGPDAEVVIIMPPLEQVSIALSSAARIVLGQWAQGAFDATEAAGYMAELAQIHAYVCREMSDYGGSQ